MVYHYNFNFFSKFNFFLFFFFWMAIYAFTPQSQPHDPKLATMDPNTSNVLMTTTVRLVYTEFRPQRFPKRPYSPVSAPIGSLHIGEYWSEKDSFEAQELYPIFAPWSDEDRPAMLAAALRPRMSISIEEIKRPVARMPVEEPKQPVVEALKPPTPVVEAPKQPVVEAPNPPTPVVVVTPPPPPALLLPEVQLPPAEPPAPPHMTPVEPPYYDGKVTVVTRDDLRFSIIKRAAVPEEQAGAAAAADDDDHEATLLVQALSRVSAALHERREHFKRQRLMLLQRTGGQGHPSQATVCFQSAMAAAAQAAAQAAAGATARPATRSLAKADPGQALS